MNKILLIFVFVSIGLAQIIGGGSGRINPGGTHKLAGAVTPSGGATQIAEDFSGGTGTGDDDNDQIQDWTAAGVHASDNWDDSNTTSALDDVEDLSVGMTDEDDSDMYFEITSTDTIDFAWWMKIDDGETDDIGCYIDHAPPGPNGPGSISHLAVQWDGTKLDTRLYYDVSSSNNGTDENLKTGQIYYFRIQYIQGSGANAEYRFFIDSTKVTSADGWPSADITITDGTSTTAVGVIGFYSDGIDAQADKIIYTTDGTAPFWE